MSLHSYPGADGGGGSGGSAEVTVQSLAALIAAGPATGPTIRQTFVRLGGYAIPAWLLPNGEVGFDLDKSAQQIMGSFMGGGFNVIGGYFTDFSGAVEYQEGDPSAPLYTDQIAAPHFTGGAAGFTSATFTPGEGETINPNNPFFGAFNVAWPGASSTAHEGLCGLSNDIVGPPSAGSSLIGLNFDPGAATDFLRFIWRGSGGPLQAVDLPGVRGVAEVFTLFLGWREGFANPRATLYSRRTRTVVPEVDELELTGSLPDELLGVQMATNANGVASPTRLLAWFRAIVPVRAAA